MTRINDTRLTRRALLSVIAAAGATACTGPVITVRRPTPDGSGWPSPSPSANASEARPQASGDGRYEPIAGDAFPNAKRLAGRFAESLLTYGPKARPRDVVRRASRLADRLWDNNKVERVASPLFVQGAKSRGEVVYAQLGGLAFGAVDRSCVMVVVRQHLQRDDGEERTITRTLDVRLASRDDEWRLEDLADAGGAAVDKPADGLPEVAREVLEDTRIELPDTARWDILRGDIDERLLTTMRDMAALTPYAVAVLKTGHPKNVFGTDRISGHTLGRGVDIWRVGSEPVVLQQPSKTSGAYDFTEALLDDLKVPELGSPWDLDGPPEPGKTKPSFTDAVHADHIHVAFKAA